MKITNKVFFVAVGLLVGSLQISAQSCMDLYQRANSLRDSKKWLEAISYYQRAKKCDPNLRRDCDEQIEKCRKRLPVLEISDQEILIPYQGGDKQIKVKSTDK